MQLLAMLPGGYVCILFITIIMYKNMAYNYLTSIHEFKIKSVCKDKCQSQQSVDIRERVILEQ